MEFSLLVDQRVAMGIVQRYVLELQHQVLKGSWKQLICALFRSLHRQRFVMQVLKMRGLEWVHAGPFLVLLASVLPSVLGALLH